MASVRLEIVVDRSPVADLCYGHFLESWARTEDDSVVASPNSVEFRFWWLQWHRVEGVRTPFHFAQGVSDESLRNGS